MARARILHTITTFAASAGAVEYVRLTAGGLPRDRFEVFVATRPGQSMEARLPSHVCLLPVPHLGRAIRSLAPRPGPLSRPRRVYAARIRST